MSTDSSSDDSSEASQVTPDPARGRLAKRDSTELELVSGEIVFDGPEGELLPPMLTGHATPALAEKTRTFFLSVASMFETWLLRTKNVNTQRTYRRGVLNYIEFLGTDWPKNSHEFLQATVHDVQAWRDAMELDGQAPATLNARISAVSRFYGFMREVATEMRLPLQSPNPAHAQFIRREATDPVRPTVPVTRTLAHRLMSLPSSNGEESSEALDARDRAILASFLYVGARISTVCNLNVSDFHDDRENPVLSVQEKGKKKSRRRVGIHAHCAEAIREYLEVADIERGPLFRARLNSRSKKLGSERISTRSMYRLLLGYLLRLPHATDQDGRCRYSPHSLRSTTATLLDEAGVGIKKIQELLGHKDIRVTQQYIKLGNDTRKSASHDVPL